MGARRVVWKEPNETRDLVLLGGAAKRNRGRAFNVAVGMVGIAFDTGVVFFGRLDCILVSGALMVWIKLLAARIPMRWLCCVDVVVQ